MKRILALIFCFFIVSLLISCVKLDNNLFSPINSITSYEWDNYTGEIDFRLDTTYAIPDSLLNELVLFSKASNESQATEIYALYIGSKQRIATDTVVMYCHGNYGHMDYYWQRAKLLANVGGKCRYGVLMIDYRGYGLSKGKPSEEGMYADVDAALQWLKNYGLSDDRLIMYGFSLGTAPACELSANVRSMRPSRLLLEAPFASAAVMVQDASALSMPASFVTDLKIDNAEEIKKIQQPFLWMHGTDDNFLSIKTHGEVVFKNYQGTDGRPYRIQGAGHSTVPQTMGFIYYKDVVDEFIRGL